MAGYIKLPTKILDAPIIYNAEAIRVCVWLYANVDENGQIQFSSGDAMRLFRISPRQYRTIVNLLKTTSVATIKTTNKTTSITLCDLDWYEANIEAKRQTKRQIKRQTVTDETSSESITKPTSTMDQLATPKKDDILLFADIFNNKVCNTSIPKIRGLSDARLKALRSIVKEHGDMMILEQAVDRAVASDFLSGRKTDFHASFDWIFKKSNFIKIIEGNYDNGTASSTSNGSGRYAAEREADRQRVGDGLRAAMEIIACENGFM